MDAYGPCLFCLELRTGKWAGKVKGCLDTAMQPIPSELHYRIAPAVLVASLNEADDTKWVAQEAFGRLREELHRLRQRCGTTGIGTACDKFKCPHHESQQRQEPCRYR